MSNSAFLLGRMFKIFDEFHELYCKVVRGDAHPPKYIGASIFEMAVISPLRAYTTLVKRGQVYYSWARTYPNRSESHKKGEEWIVGRLINLMKLLEECEDNRKEIPGSFNSVDEKALFINGYHSSLKVEKNGEKNV